VVVAAIYIFAVSWDPQKVPRGSVAYFFGIPASVRAIPLVEPCREPRYSYVGYEGTKGSFSTVEYGSALDHDEVLAFYRDWFQRGNCALREDGGVLFADRCSAPVHLFNSDVAIQEGIGISCRTVTVTAIGE